MEENSRLAHGAAAKRFALYCAMLGSMTSILSGYDTGVMSGASLFIQRDLKISDVKLEILVGTINLFSLVGACFAGKTADWIGRKYTILLAAAIFFAGAVMMGWGFNYAFLMAGRVVAGIGVGFAFVSAPVYTTELAPATARGFLTSFPEVFINLGVLLGYVSNYAFAKLPLKLGWRLMLGIGVLPSLVMAGLVCLMPESPRWLVLKGRLGDAKKVLLRTCASPEEAEERLLDIKQAAGIPLDCNDDVVQMPKREKGNETWRELLHPSDTLRRILIAAIGIHFFQQGSGVDAVVLYSPRIFQKAGIKSQMGLLGATVAVGVSKTLCIFIPAFLLDKVGRRPLLLTSVTGMIVSVMLLCFGLYTIDHHPNHELKWALVMCIAMVLFYVGFFSVGLGPIAWVYSAEIYPLRLRGVGSSFGAGTNRVMSGIVGTTFISMTKAMTTAGSFFFYGGMTICGWLFIFFFLPETRGRNLEDIGELFGTSNWRRNKTQQQQPNNHTSVPV